jgi:hypothetical protein
LAAIDLNSWNDWMRSPGIYARHCRASPGNPSSLQDSFEVDGCPDQVRA